MGCWFQAMGSETDGQQQGCHFPDVLCDEDKCLEPEKMCDGTADCVDGMDEVKGFCKE